MAKSKFSVKKMVVGSAAEAALFSFVHVFEKTSPPDSDKEYYGVQIILPKDYDEQIEELKGLIKECKDEVIAEINPTKKQLREFHNPLKDGDDDDEHERNDRPEIRGCMFFGAKSYERQPQVVGADGKTMLIDDEDFYSGCYGRATIVVKGFEASGKIGVSMFLNNIQKFNVEAERLGGGAPSAESEFDTVDDDKVKYNGEDLDALAEAFGF